MHQRWQSTAPLTNLSLADSGILLSLPPPPAAQPPNRAGHQSGHTFPQACLESPSTSQNVPSYIPQSEAWVVTCSSSSSVCVAALFLLGAKSSGKAEDTAFFWVVTMLLTATFHCWAPPTAKCKCIPVALSWAGEFVLLKYPALPLKLCLLLFLTIHGSLFFRE